MPTIKNPLTDLLTKLRTLTVTNPDKTAVTPHVRIWNNQLSYDLAGQLQSFPKPAFFLETVSPQEYQIMGEGYRNADIVFRVHIIHEYYNAPDGTYEQDLPVFDLRDDVVRLLTRYAPSGCGPLECMYESQDYEHNNLYHYVMDFVANFTDDAGRKLYIIKDPVTDLQIDVQTAKQDQTIFLNAMQLKAYSTSYTSTVDGTKVFLVLDSNGNKIVGANIVSVTIEIKPLTGPNRWQWDENASQLTLLGDEQVDAGQTAFIIFQQQLASAN